MATTTIDQKEKKVFEALKEVLNIKNTLQVPRLEKIVISSGIGSIKDKTKIDVVQDRLAKITGQKPAPRQAKKSVASFKIRQGDVVGYQVTLRGERMRAFLDKLIHVALPRTKDFRGLSRTGVDEMGNMTIGIPEHTVFPESSDEELKDIFGLSITIVTSARDKQSAEKYFEYLGIPFKKDDQNV